MIWYGTVLLDILCFVWWYCKLMVGKKHYYEIFYFKSGLQINFFFSKRRNNPEEKSTSDITLACKYDIELFERHSLMIDGKVCNPCLMLV
jgi:hypothetical protein